MIKSLFDFGQTITKIREAVNSIEIKGRQNSSYVVYINCQCDELINEINEIARTSNISTQKSDIEHETDGDFNEQNSGSPE